MMADWSLSDAYSEQKGDVVSLEIGSRLYEHLLRDADFTSGIRELRKEIFRNLGVYLPSVRIKADSGLDPDRYVIRIRGRRAADGTLRPPLKFSIKHGSGPPAIHPVRRVEGVWTEEEGESCREIVTSHLRQVLNRRIEDLLTYDIVVRWLNQAKNHAPDLVKELTERGHTPGLLWAVMKNLLKDRVPLHPFEELLETILEYYLTHPHEGYTPPEWTHPHPEAVAKYIATKKKERLPVKKTGTGNVIGFNR